MPLQNSSTAAAQARKPAVEAQAEREAFDKLFSAAYEELRRLAATVKRGNLDNTLTPTALVNEAWLKLHRSPGIGSDSPLHFKRIAARAMRQLLIESARRRHADKRGGTGGAVFVTFDESLKSAPATAEELLVLDSTLTELAHFEPRQAAIVESRFFGGLEVREIAELLGISEATVLRDWRAAKAWLGQRLHAKSESKAQPVKVADG
jgi:RNA polymerase sigma factor (TIGR02999 family)